MTTSPRTEDHLAHAAFDRYLRILGTGRAGPSFENLQVLTARSLETVPFENVSKIFQVKTKGIRTVPPLEQFLDGIEQFSFGGTCYAANYYFNQLLHHLGYSVRLCAADISVSGAPPNSHMVSIVTIDGREWLVDVGYGAPFRQPLPRTSEEHTVEFGVERYLLKPVDQDGRSRLEVYLDGQLRHGYVAKPAATTAGYFAEVIARSYADSAPFLNRLIVARFLGPRYVVLRNSTLTISTAASVESRRLASRPEIVEAIVDNFGMPAAVVTQVVDTLAEQQLFG